MKKLFITLVLLFLNTTLFGQTSYDSPRTTVGDTLSLVNVSDSRDTQDFWFNPANLVTSKYFYNYGIVDINVEGDVISGTTDTLVVECYGLKKIKHSITEGHGADGYSTYATDSTRLGTMPLTTTKSLKSFGVDLEMSTFFQYDGIRVVLKLGGTDADSVHVWSQARVYIPSREMY